MLATYFHNISPYLWHFPGSQFGIRWYGFSYLLGIVAGYLLLRYLSRKGKFPIALPQIADFVLMLGIVGVIGGGRLGHVFFYDPQLLLDFGTSVPFWGVLRIYDGGMSAHGGVIGVILVLIFWSWRYKVSFWRIGDAVVMVVPLGLMFGRIANFINGELYGKVTKVAWAVQFPQELKFPPDSPTEPRVTDATLNTMLDSLLAKHPEYETLLRFPRQGLIDLAQRGEQPIINALQTILPTRHPSQLYECLLEGVLLFVLVWSVGMWAKRPGLAGATFMLGYPVMRIIGEQFRVGDAPILLLGREFSLGEIYSAVMFLAGVVVLALVWLRKENNASEPNLNTPPQ